MRPYGKASMGMIVPLAPYLPESHTTLNKGPAPLDSSPFKKAFKRFFEGLLQVF